MLDAGSVLNSQVSFSSIRKSIERSSPSSSFANESSWS